MALGMIEVYGFTTSIIVADRVAKTADVKLVAIDKNKPAGGDSAEVPLVMIVKFEGAVSAVEEAMAAGSAEAQKSTERQTLRVSYVLSCICNFFKRIGVT